MAQQSRGQTGQGQGRTGQTQEIEQYVQNADFPCERRELERVAQRNDAPRQVLDHIRQMPDKRYNNVSEVQDAFRRIQTTTR